MSRDPKATEMVMVRLPPELKDAWERALDARKISRQAATTALIEWFLQQSPLVQAMVLDQIPSTPSMLAATIADPDKLPADKSERRESSLWLQPQILLVPVYPNSAFILHVTPAEMAEVVFISIHQAIGKWMCKDGRSAARTLEAIDHADGASSILVGGDNLVNLLMIYDQLVAQGFESVRIVPHISMLSESKKGDFRTLLESASRKAGMSFYLQQSGLTHDGNWADSVREYLAANPGTRVHRAPTNQQTQVVNDEPTGADRRASQQRIAASAEDRKKKPR